LKPRTAPTTSTLIIIIRITNHLTACQPNARKRGTPLALQ
jgi:hypothetical protein